MVKLPQNLLYPDEQNGQRYKKKKKKMDNQYKKYITFQLIQKKKATDRTIF